MPAAIAPTDDSVWPWFLPRHRRRRDFLGFHWRRAAGGKVGSRDLGERRYLVLDTRSSGCRRQRLGLNLLLASSEQAAYDRRSGSLLSIVRSTRPESGRSRGVGGTGAAVGLDARVFWPARAVGMGCVSSAMMSCAEIAGASDSVGGRFALGFDSGADLLCRLRAVAETGSTISFDSCTAAGGASDDSRATTSTVGVSSSKMRSMKCRSMGMSASGTSLVAAGTSSRRGCVTMLASLSIASASLRSGAFGTDGAASARTGGSAAADGDVFGCNASTGAGASDLALMPA